jgi:hypothetical protein
MSQAAGLSLRAKCLYLWLDSKLVCFAKRKRRSFANRLTLAVGMGLKRVPHLLDSVCSAQISGYAEPARPHRPLTGGTIGGVKRFKAGSSTT